MTQTHSFLEQTVSFTFAPGEYAEFMDENPMLRFTVMAMMSSGQTYAKQVVVTIDKYVLKYYRKNLRPGKFVVWLWIQIISSSSGVLWNSKQIYIHAHYCHVVF